jgi:L-alanine-DL-glutamate epimerase-like enolase superfamily enzyme
MGSTDGVVERGTLQAVERLICTFREAVGPDVGIALDLNYNFRPEAVVQIAKVLEPFDLQWLEYDIWNPRPLLEIKEATSIPIASCESLVSTRQYLPFFELRAADVAIIDVPWNGFGQSVKIGSMADACEMVVAPHNYYSHLADLHSIHLCAVLPNVRIMEIDIDDVPWKKDLVTHPPVIRDGHIEVPTGPGWGAEIDEEVLREHLWERAPHFGY